MNYKVKVEIITPTHIGVGNEGDWVRNIDFVIQNGQLYKLDIKKLTEKIGVEQLVGNFQNGNHPWYPRTPFPREVEQCSEKHFRCRFTTSNNVKVQIKNKLTQNPIIPGSSLKGAIGGVLLKKIIEERTDNLRDDLRTIFSEHLNHHNELKRQLNRLNNQLIERFKTSRNSNEPKVDLRQFLKIKDAEFASTEIVNTKIFNLRRQGQMFAGGWKHDSNNTDERLREQGFNTLYEAISIKQTAFVSINIDSERFRYFINQTGISIDENRRNLFTNDINYLFRLINEHTREYLKKELKFFQKYDEAEKADEITDSINDLLGKIELFINNNNKSCLIKIGAGSGFHAITGDWQFDDYSITGVSDIDRRRRGTLNGILSAKSRKIAITNDGNLYLMGFVKLTYLTEEELKALEKEKQQEQIRIQQQNEEKKKREEEERKREEEFNRLFAEAEKLKAEKKYDEALSKIAEAEKIKTTNELKNLKQEIEKIKKFEAGFTAFIEEKNLNGDYKVKDFKTLLDKIKKYLKIGSEVKKMEIQKIDENDFEMLKRNIIRIYETLKPKDKEKVKQKDYYLWKELQPLTSEQFINDVIDSLQ